LEDKKILRASIQEERDRFPENKRITASKKIAASFLNTKYYASAHNILIFYPFRSEVNTIPIIEKTLRDGKKIILPRVEGKDLKLCFIDNIKTQLKSGVFGIMEPDMQVCREAKITEIDLAVIPGVCFDKAMNRIGYGGGFYDRLIPLLKNSVKKIALCFDLQVISCIPSQIHDRKVDLIITESKIYKEDGKNCNINTGF
jgi:5-formyltetrahydrofolate cyclo-ligase